MRTFRLIGMALLALCVNFASCSSDDDEIIKNEEGIVTNQKKLVQMDDDDLTYDAKGRLISIGDYGWSKTWDYIWAEGTIVCREDIITIENNLLRSVEDEDETISFTYNSKNQLVKIESKDKDYPRTFEITFVWEDDKIIKQIYGNNDFEEYTYSGKTCKRMMFYPIYTEEDNPWPYLIAAHPELLGTPCLQLPDSEIHHRDDNTEYTTNYSYDLDEDGYVVSTIKRGESGYTETFTFKWE